MRRTILLLAAALLSLVSFAHGKDPGLVVHEWGTFTLLQDETGRALGAINEDVELLPDFVHRLVPDEGGPKGYPTSEAVTMRLETPVVYFHLPENAKPMTVSFSAEFHGGLLTQFYPDAKTNVGERLPKIDASTVGKIVWNNVTIGAPARGPATASHVWVAPRKVDAADVTSRAGEAERYLFYRGVGHIDSPVAVLRKADQLQLYGNFGESYKLADQAGFGPDPWYFDVLPNGKCAFRRLRWEPSDNIGQPFAHTPPAFEDSDYRRENAAALRASMKPELIKAGLFDDEAEAMLNTWEDSYFETPGTRVFFIVPRAWVDEHLPIKVSVPAKFERVMVGRIDLVTPKHHDLARLYLSQPDKNTPQAQTILSAMGRFGKAIVADEQAKRSMIPAPTVD